MFQNIFSYNYINKYRRYLPFLALLITLLCYLNSINNQILNWDDGIYLFGNSKVKTLSFSNIRYYFTESYNSTYIPLTMLNWAFEYYLWGSKPMGYIIVNIILHIVNTCLVYYLIIQWTDKRNLALLCMLLFGLHPIHVESVVWITERKDVLYTLFFFLSLWQYGIYLNKIKELNRKIWRQKNLLLSFLFFTLSLLSKGQAVVLPVILLLLDYYKERKIFSIKVWLEKAPFFILSLFFGLLAMYFQMERKHLYSFDFAEKIMFSSYAFIHYILKTLFPLKLSAAYPFPLINGTFPAYLIIYLISAVSVIILLVFLLKRKIFYGFGLAFYIINILPMLDHSSVGNLVMCDRFVYIGSLGLLLLIGGIAYFIKEHYAYTMKFILLFFIAYLAFMAAQTISRCKVWKNDKTLFTDAINKYPENPVAYNSLGYYYFHLGKNDSALKYFNKAIMFIPKFASAYSGRGNTYQAKGDTKSAISDFMKAIQLKPEFTEAYNNLGVLYKNSGDFEMAMKCFNKAIQTNPIFADAFNNRGVLKAEMGDISGAFKDIDISIALAPDNVKSYANRGYVKYTQKDYYGAIEDFNKALKINPTEGMIYFNRGVSRLNFNDTAGACNDWIKAESLGFKHASITLRQYCN